MNNNDTNNNLNGTVLGSVGNTTNINNNTISDNIETLDGGLNTMPNDNVNNNSQTQSTFFNNPPINDINNNLEVGSDNSQPTYTEPTPQVQPMPNYTNPQSINPNPMPGFENSNIIGTTPPISFEPEKKPEKKPNKLIFIIIILVVLAGVGFGTFYVLNYTDLLKKADQISIVTKDLEVSMGDELSNKVSDYATITGTDSKNCTVNLTEVDITKEGEYTYKVTCGETIKSGKITVVDNSELVVKTQIVYKTNGETIEPKDFIKDPDDSIVYEFVDKASVESILTGEEGTYPIKIKATNKSNKTVELEVNLVVMKYAIKGYLICSSKEQNVSNPSAVMTVSNKFAIVDDGNNGYGNIATEIHTFKFSDETEYTNLLATYKTDQTITINNVTGDTSFDDDNLTITISNERDNNKVISEYGESNLTNYSTIKSYFENTLGYKCTYNKK